MALFPCPECDKQISEKALSCTNCGAPIFSKKDLTKLSWSQNLNLFIARAIYACAFIILCLLILKFL